MSQGAVASRALNKNVISLKYNILENLFLTQGGRESCLRQVPKSSFVLV